MMRVVISLFFCAVMQGCATTTIVDQFGIGAGSGASLQNGGEGPVIGAGHVTEFVQFNDSDLEHGLLIAGKDAQYLIPAGFAAVDVRINYLSHAITGKLQYGHGAFAFDARRDATYSLRAEPAEDGARIWLLENGREMAGPLAVEWTLDRFVEHKPLMSIPPPSPSEVGRTTECHELWGYWKLVPLRDESINEVNPWPLPHQWFAFLPDGRFLSMMTNEADYKSRWELEAILNQLGSEVPRYRCDASWLVISYPGDDGLEIWGKNTLLVHARAESKMAFAPGDIALTLAAPDDGRMIYFRHLRRVDRDALDD